MVGKHYYNFGKDLTKKISGNSLNQGNWDVLRNDEVEGPFSIEKTVESYETNCKKSILYERVAKIIIEELASQKRIDKKVVSCGVGKGILEYHLKNLCPELYVECTDYTEDAIEKLKAVFVAMDSCYTFDMLNGDYSAFGADSTIIMFRVSTEFNRKQWNTIFKKMYDDGIKNVIYVPTDLDTPKSMRGELRNHIINIFRGRKDIFCGWLYTEDEFLGMFKGNGKSPLYSVEKKVNIENTAIYFLLKV